MEALSFIDLFCGCGGFSLGMTRAGFECLAAIDFDPDAVQTFRANLCYGFGACLAPERVLRQDLTQYSPKELAQVIGTNRVDVIVGGPPCQGFSTARQVDGANHGRRLKPDPRRLLYREFLRFVEFFQPRVFIMENVLGIRTAAGGAYFTAVQKEARELGRKRGCSGYRVHAQVEDAWELGVPQKRRRQLIIGVRKDLPGFFPPTLAPAPRAEPRTWLGAAIGDLPILRAGAGEDECNYDLARRKTHLQNGGNTVANYLFRVLEINRARKLTNHVARPHSERDLRDFARLREGENSATAMRDRGVKFDFPYDKSSFKDRYTRQSRWKPCSTIVAHLSKDGLMFIHPTQNRSLTPREAARIQGFPDWFRFPKARTKSFRLIGNAVPPLVSEAVGIAAKKLLEEIMESTTGIKFWLKPLPKDDNEAVEWLLPLLDLDARALRAIDAAEFKKAWFAIAFLYMGLHPDSALDHGKTIAHDHETASEIRGREPRLLSPYFERSGWPVVLAPIAKEAWRRYEAGQLSDEEFYCSEAQMAGICHRNPHLASEVKAEREKAHV